MVFEKFKRSLRKKGEDTPDYLEIDLDRDKPADSKVIVKTFVLRAYEDVNPILNALREGFTIAIIDIRILKSKDIVELKRVISKVKKTIEALEGSIAGFGENVVIATPSFARIEKGDIVEEKPARERIERY